MSQSLDSKDLYTIHYADPSFILFGLTERGV